MTKKVSNQSLGKARDAKQVAERVAPAARIAREPARREVTA